MGIATSGIEVLNRAEDNSSTACTKQDTVLKRKYVHFILTCMAICIVL